MSDRQEIFQVIETYLEGMRTGDPEHWKRAFWSDCVVINANEEDHEKSITPIMDYAKFIKDQHDAGITCEEFPQGHPRIGYVGNIGNVRVRWRFVLGDQTLNGETFFNLVKRRGVWKVSQKIYYVTS